MRFIFTTLLAVAFFGTAVLGIFAMGHNLAHSSNSCIVATAQKTNCPQKMVGLMMKAYYAPSMIEVNRYEWQLAELYPFPFQYELIHWLALHENSPSVI